MQGARARNLDLQGIQLALLEGPRLDVRSKDGRTALHEVLSRDPPRANDASGWSRVKGAVQLLLGAGACWNHADPRGVTPLYEAWRRGYLNNPEIKRLVNLQYTDEGVREHCLAVEMERSMARSENQ